MNKTDAMREARRSAAEAAAKAAEARAALRQMRRAAVAQMRHKARDLAAQAQTRARGEAARRRSAAADRLETLAGAIRPEREARARNRGRTIAVAGGSGLALTAALGLGVALGFMLSRGLKKRAGQGVGTYFSRQPGAPHGEVAETDEAAMAAGLEDLAPEDSPERGIRPEDAPLIEASERMEPDYRERKQAGSEL